MGRKVVVEIECDRCTRTEHREVKQGQAEPEIIFEGNFMGQKVVYKDLCTACREIVEMRWAEIAKELKKASPQRDRSKKEKPVAAAPATVPQQPKVVTPPPAPGQKSGSPGAPSQRP